MKIEEYCEILNIPTDQAERVRKLAPYTLVHKPYTMWTHDGSRYAGFTGEQVPRLFRGYEEASPLVEVLALAIQFPEFFNPTMLAPATGRDVGFLQGYWVKSREMAYVFYNKDHHRFSVATTLHDRLYNNRGILSRGRQINLAV